MELVLCVIHRCNVVQDSTRLPNSKIIPLVVNQGRRAAILTHVEIIFTFYTSGLVRGAQLNKLHIIFKAKSLKKGTDLDGVCSPHSL